MDTRLEYDYKITIPSAAAKEILLEHAKKLMPVLPGYEARISEGPYSSRDWVVRLEEVTE